MAKAPTVQDFFKRFPDDDTCLEHLMMLRFGNPLFCPKCGAEGQFAKLKKLPAYACPSCGHHIHPMVGTPFERSRTPLQKWFYAMYLFTTSRHGVPAKELQRQLGVTYKTAWRMGHELRKHMGDVDGEPPLSGHVEIDETYVGGKRPYNYGRSTKYKSVVMGISERGGELFTKVVPDATHKSLLPEITRQVPKGTRVSTDEWRSCVILPKLGYDHQVVRHRKEEWVRDDTHVNTLEGFWSMLKRSIRGTHIHVSRRHLPKYLAEFEFRWNLRHAPETMFARLLMSF